MSTLRPGGRYILRPTPSGGYETTREPLEDPMEGAGPNERRFFEENYADLSRLELMRRLRGAEWDLAHYKEEAQRLQQQAREMPPLYKVQEMNERMKRIRALTKVPRRRSIPKPELLDILYNPLNP